MDGLTLKKEVLLKNLVLNKLGVRVNPLSTDEGIDFERGRPITINADRTLKRGARRNFDRYQLRRDKLIAILKRINFITEESSLTEIGNDTTFETWTLRAKSVTQKVEKEEFARILLAINKKRGYKSSRKAKNDEEGEIVDGMVVAKILHDKELTPGQFAFQLLQSGKKNIPDFYRSDLEEELDEVWKTQKEFHPYIFSGQVVGETAKSLSERFGKVLQKRQSLTINRNDKSTSISTQLDSLIPASKISTLTQGIFVGAVSDNFEERINQKIFHAGIVVDNDAVATETKAYQQIPQILSFVDKQGNDQMKLEIEANYKQIKKDIVQIIETELERIKNDPDLQHLIQQVE